MAHRYRLCPQPVQADTLALHCEHARFVWNLALEQWRCWRPGRRSAPGSAERMRQLAEARRGSFLAKGSSSVQQQALRDFDRAVNGFYVGSHGRPRWRKRGRREGFCVRDVSTRKLNHRWAELTVPKAGRVRFRLSRPLPTTVGMARVTLDGKGRWHVSFAAFQPTLDRVASGRAVGVDRGVVTTVATSDGQMRRAPVMRAHERRRLANLERQKARQRSGSKRRYRTVTRIARLHQGVADRRRNWVETDTTRLVRDYDLIAVERLQVRNMVRRPRPQRHPEHAGMFRPNGARAKAGLNRSILAQGWSMWLRRLSEKAIASGMVIVEVNPAHTSDQCRACGHSEPANRESQAVFRCRSCGHTGHADFEAASNILARAVRLAPTPGSGATENDSVPAPARRAEPAAAGTSQ